MCILFLVYFINPIGSIIEKSKPPKHPECVDIIIVYVNCYHLPGADVYSPNLLLRGYNVWSEAIKPTKVPQAINDSFKLVSIRERQ